MCDYTGGVMHCRHGCEQVWILHPGLVVFLGVFAPIDLIRGLTRLDVFLSQCHFSHMNTTNVDPGAGEIVEATKRVIHFRFNWKERPLYVGEAIYEVRCSTATANQYNT